MEPLNRSHLQQFVVTAAEMRQIEERVFAAGMPVAALMEKVAGLLTQRFQAQYPRSRSPRVGVLVGPGHNGGDALVVARELHLNGYEVLCYQPFSKLKDLTASHAQYVTSLGVSQFSDPAALQTCDVLIDGLFGFGLTRSLEGEIAAAINQINQLAQPIVSIDLPSGLQTDTGEVLGTAIRADRTFCLGLWKRAFLQENALAYLGKTELIDFGLPLTDIQAVLGKSPTIQRITSAMAIGFLPLPRPTSTHKYKQGHLLLICGSRRFSGAALLAGLAARSSGVGMLSIAVPESLKPLLIAALPDALILGCPEDSTGAIAALPPDVDLAKYQVIACGPGLTPQAQPIVQQVLDSSQPLILDADGLNSLANLGTLPTLQQRSAPTILTPHSGEFKRLFPEIDQSDRILAVQSAAKMSRAIVLLKGARTAIANAQGQVWLNPDSTPALARGGSGDVLTGLMGGLIAQGLMRDTPIESMVCSATWWHAQAGIHAAQERTELGVDAVTLAHSLIPTLSCLIKD